MNRSGWFIGSYPHGWLNGPVWFRGSWSQFLLRHHPLFQFVHGDHWVHFPGWGCCVQLGAEFCGLPVQDQGFDPFLFENLTFAWMPYLEVICAEIAFIQIFQDFFLLFGFPSFPEGFPFPNWSGPWVLSETMGTHGTPLTWSHKATLPPWPYRPSSTATCSTSKSCMKWRRWSQRTWTRSSIETTTRWKLEQTRGVSMGTNLRHLNGDGNFGSGWWFSDGLSLLALTRDSCSFKECCILHNDLISYQSSNGYNNKHNG